MELTELKKRIDILEGKLFVHGYIPKKMEQLLKKYRKQYNEKVLSKGDH